MLLRTPNSARRAPVCRHSKGVSGFRTRMSTPGGKRVIKARRKKGRKTLCPASLRKNGKTRV